MSPPPMTIDETIVRLSWVHIIEGQVLFAKAPGGDVYFDPGVRREPALPGEDQRHKDELTLARKIRQDFGIELRLPMVGMTSFAAPAYGKPEGVMVEIHYFMADIAAGVLDPAQVNITPYIERMRLCTGADIELEDQFSPASIAILQFLRQHGLIYRR